MSKIYYLHVNDSRTLDKTHSYSWKFACNGIVLDEVLDNIIIDKERGYDYE